MRSPLGGGLTTRMSQTARVVHPDCWGLAARLQPTTIRESVPSDLIRHKHDAVRRCNSRLADDTRELSNEEMPVLPRKQKDPLPKRDERSKIKKALGDSEEICPFSR